MKDLSVELKLPLAEVFVFDESAANAVPLRATAAMAIAEFIKTVFFIEFVG